MPTCPGWTVQGLVAHLARVQSWVRAALRDPTEQGLAAARPPEHWDDLLTWWDEQLNGLLEGVADPSAPAWLPFDRAPQTARSWARRQAHEAAIHRLDAEHARAGSADPNSVPALLFEPGFAADGVEELIYWVVSSLAGWKASNVSGTVLLHAADAGQTWTVRVEPGAPPKAEPDGLAVDVTVEGTADAVYRRLWGRPSHASVTGEVGVLEPLRAP